ncbi:MAG: PAS domain-containing protein [Chloroflexi bacterium]|nr:PAS domain-containing protein [Chloroflexota bacterium]
MDDVLLDLDFLQDGGGMGARMRSHDWNASSLGPPAKWPQSLRLTVRLMLNTKHPMFIFWGPEHLQFYNDAYRRTIGPEKHPSAFGRPARYTWAEIWNVIGPQIAYVMAGKGSTWDEDRLIPITRYGKLENVWWTYSYSPIDVDDDIGGVLVVCNDVTEAHMAHEMLRLQGERLRVMFEQAPGFVAVLTGSDHRFEMVNDAYRRLLGQRDLIGLTPREVVPEVEAQGFLNLLDIVYQTGVPHVGTRIPMHLDATSADPVRDYIIDFVYSPILAGDGSVSGIFVQGNDVTAHVQAEEHLRLMNLELRHRGKNLLSIVGAIAAQTMRGVPQLDSFRDRLQTFDTANDVLISDGHMAAPVPDLVAAVLRPYGALGGRIQVNGPPVVIGAKPALTLSMALHELAVNATKYGALSNETGRVSATWDETVEDGRPVFRFDWVERGGPPVVEPTRTGFGSPILRSVLAADFGGTVDIRYDPEGLSCQLTAPIAGLREAARSAGTSHPA